MSPTSHRLPYQSTISIGFQVESTGIIGAARNCPHMQRSLNCTRAIARNPVTTSQQTPTQNSHHHRTATPHRMQCNLFGRARAFRFVPRAPDKLATHPICSRISRACVRACAHCKSVACPFAVRPMPSISAGHGNLQCTRRVVPLVDWARTNKKFKLFVRHVQPSRTEPHYCQRPAVHNKWWHACTPARQSSIHDSIVLSVCTFEMPDRYVGGHGCGVVFSESRTFVLLLLKLWSQFQNRLS